MSSLLINIPDAFALLTPDSQYPSYIGIGINNDLDHNIICHHHNSPKLPFPNNDLCAVCQELSHEYYFAFLLQWKMSLGALNPSSFGSPFTRSSGQSQQLPNSDFHFKLDLILEYALAMNDLHDRGFAPPLGLYPREAIVERLLGMKDGDIQTIKEYCIRKPCPVIVRQYDSYDPPIISRRFRRFLTDPCQSNRKAIGFLRDMDVVHRNLAKAFMLVFLNPRPDVDVEDGGIELKEVKAFAGVMWIQHVLRAGGGFDNEELSEFFRGVDVLRWFEWVLKEEWREGFLGDRVVNINPVELVSQFVNLFLNVKDSIRVANITYLDRQLKRFLNGHFISHQNQSTDTTLPTRFISAFFYLNFPHGVSHRPNDLLAIPSCLRLNRHFLIELLSFNTIENGRDDALEDLDKPTRKRMLKAEETNLDFEVPQELYVPAVDTRASLSSSSDPWNAQVWEVDLGSGQTMAVKPADLVPPKEVWTLPIPLAKVPKFFEGHTPQNSENQLVFPNIPALASDLTEAELTDIMLVDYKPLAFPTPTKFLSQYDPFVRLPDETEMDRVFECIGLFEVWDWNGERSWCRDVWRGMKDTHEDLAMCCLGVLIQCELRKERDVDDRVLLYARHAWSYHLSFSSYSFKLIRLVEVLTVAVGMEGYGYGYGHGVKLDNGYCHHPSRVVDWLRGIPFKDLSALRLLAKWEPLLDAGQMDGVVPSTPTAFVEDDDAEADSTSNDYATYQARPGSISETSSLLSSFPTTHSIYGDSSMSGPSDCSSIASTIRPTLL
ncbi:hypothetical protein BDN72DRAFT_841122 [Pluteus cervinus]|uniref:Uncharacterized protein n=1 Tax=Pluteus cervinus TaxID=181527 RepID=A0ACD3ASV3_9AGAR|nr:hypothetical protein BDN72DRAFT_841122 [Pluteus cervinus]